ncbi:MAG: hypothetical protein KatS3mg103_0043 [Phycisphaerales bacterium]|nr:MAG: hypothetical protein KatS3mg103_0043 [Phycisphaerales bacterium]
MGLVKRPGGRAAVDGPKGRSPCQGPFWGPGRFLLVVALLIAVTASLLVLRERQLKLGRFELAAAVLEIIQKKYVQPTDPTALSRAAISGMLEHLEDPNSVYVPPDVAEQFNRVVMGQDYVGIGVQVLRRDGFVTVLTPLAGSPAAQAGVRPGDRIVAVDGVDTTTLDTDEVTRLIAGPAGQPVMLTVERDGRRLELAVQRDHIRTESVKGLARLDEMGHWNHALDPKRQIGYVRITQFVAGTAQDARLAIERAHDQMGGLQALVLDLRHNPGGMIDQAVGVADLFLPGGPVVRTQDRQGQGVLMQASSGVAFQGPMVVLIDQASASGAEIVAGALKERLEHVRTLGTRTFGKASVQTVYALPDGGTLKLTEAYYLLPSGRNLQRLPDQDRWGVDPSEGMHVALDAQQAEHLAELHASLDTVGVWPEGLPDPAGWTSAQAVLEALDDPQLEAAHRALVGRLEQGAWPRVGLDPLPGQTLLRIAQAEQALARLEAERARLREALERLRQDEQPDADQTETSDGGGQDGASR